MAVTSKYGGVLNLNLFPGLGLDSATAAANALSTTLILPSGAQVISAIVNNNGTSITGTGPYDIGYTTTGLGTVDFIFNAVTVAGINTPGSAVILSRTTPDPNWAINATGVVLDTVLTGDSFVTVTNTAGSANSAGDLKVIIEYIIVGPQA